MAKASTYSFTSNERTWEATGHSDSTARFRDYFKVAADKIGPVVHDLQADAFTGFGHALLDARAIVFDLEHAFLSTQVPQ